MFPPRGPSESGGRRGTTPGLNFIYVHLNRLIMQHDLDMSEVRKWRWSPTQEANLSGDAPVNE